MASRLTAASRRAGICNSQEHRLCRGQRKNGEAKGKQETSEHQEEMPHVDGNELHGKPGIDQEEQAHPQRGAILARPGKEHQPPQGDRCGQPPEQPEDLPLPGAGAEQGGRLGDDPAPEGAVGGKIAFQTLCACCLRHPDEYPIIPVEAHLADEQPVGKQTY